MSCNANLHISEYHLKLILISFLLILSLIILAVPEMNSIEPTVYEQPSSFKIEFYIIIFIIIIALAVFIICTVVYLHRKVSKSKSIKSTSIPEYHVLNISNETVLTDVSQEVLFIYTRESELFCEIISNFKELFGQAEDLSVSTHY